MTRIGSSDLDVRPLSLGTNSFGWTSDEAGSHRILDAFVAAGGDFLDTADMYSQWNPNGFGISESIIGSWFAKDPANRDKVVLATKVGKGDGLEGLAPETIRKAVDGSLQRLGTDRIDLYWAHRDDETVPVEDTLAAFDDLVTAGKVRALGASNFTGARLTEALEASRRDGLASYVAVQNLYNLVERSEYEGDVSAVVVQNGLASIPYAALASGFLTGKYRPGTTVDSARQAGASAYLDTPRGPAVLAALDTVAATHGVEPGPVAIAWVAAQPGVVAPIASARTTDQLPRLMAAADLELSADELAVLEAASR